MKTEILWNEKVVNFVKLNNTSLISPDVYWPRGNPTRMLDFKYGNCFVGIEKTPFTALHCSLQSQVIKGPSFKVPENWGLIEGQGVFVSTHRVHWQCILMDAWLVQDGELETLRLISALAPTVHFLILPVGYSWRLEDLEWWRTKTDKSQGQNVNFSVSKRLWSLETNKCL